MKTTSRKTEVIHWNKGIGEVVIACGISAAHTFYSVEHHKVTCKTCLKCIEASKGNPKQITPPQIQSKNGAVGIANDTIHRLQAEIKDLKKTNDEMQKVFAQAETEWKAAMYDRDLVCINAQDAADQAAEALDEATGTIVAKETQAMLMENERDQALIEQARIKGSLQDEIDRLEKINKALLPDVPIFPGQKFAEAYAKEIQNPIGMVRDIPDDYGIAKIVGELTLKLKETTTALNQANKDSSKRQDEQEYLEKLNHRLKLRFLNLAKGELVRAEKAHLISGEKLMEYWFDDEVNLRVDGYWINISFYDNALSESALMMIRAGTPEDQPAVMPCAIVKNYVEAIGWIERKKTQDAQDKERKDNRMVSHPKTTDPPAQGDPGKPEGC